MGKSKKKKKIRALVVVAEKTVQKVGEIQVHAPLGVAVDDTTGILTTPVEVKLIGDPVFSPTIVPDKLINHGLQKACLLVPPPQCDPCKHPTPSSTKLDIPIQAMFDMPGILPGDCIQEHSEVESIDVRGFGDPNFKGCGQKTLLAIKVVYKVRVVIAREKVVTVPQYFHNDDSCESDSDDGKTLCNENTVNVIVTPDRTCSGESSSISQ